MQAFIINLDSAADRWSSVQAAFAQTRLSVCRIPAVDGATLRLPMKDYAERRFRWFHGRFTNSREIGCYLSHIQAMQTFLATPDAYGLICEDDIELNADFERVLNSALRFTKHWNILRLTGLGHGVSLRAAHLGGAYRLCVNLGRLKGTGAYVVDRVAAQAFVNHLLPMWLPFDHAIDKEWAYGLRSTLVLPFPCSQTTKRFRSSIQASSRGKRPALYRWMTTYPYQTINEAKRLLFRGFSFLQTRVAGGDATASLALDVV